MYGNHIIGKRIHESTVGNSIHTVAVTGTLSRVHRTILPISLISILLLLISLPIVLGLFIIS
jgi:hypothetical protein